MDLQTAAHEQQIDAASSLFVNHAFQKAKRWHTACSPTVLVGNSLACVHLHAVRLS